MVAGWKDNVTGKQEEAGNIDEIHKILFLFSILFRLIPRSCGFLMMYVRCTYKSQNVREERI